MHGGAFGGAKIWDSEIWPLLANWRLHCRMDRAGIYININYTSKLSILIGGAPTQTFALGGKPPQATTGFSASFLRTTVTFL